MESKTCTHCKVSKAVDDFKSIRGKELKLCSRCRESVRGYKKKYNCPHGRQRSQCVDCDGSGICDHKRRRSLCVDCGGSEMCDHRIQRRDCNACSGIKAIIKKTISHTREADRKSSRYNPDLHVDKCFLEGLFEDSPDLICPYCTEKMSLDSGDRRLVTIERINNDIGHIKSNCILACYSCNVSRVGQRKQ